MPLTRYQIRNEYGLADPDLYRAADKDDPEALLEGVAMAALVGILRQLGDLAEFAAEVFHDLHEEVITTSARGHGLMIRVQQLEAEVPSIERAFLSQTNHTSFFTSAGLDWHSNLQSEQNLVARGDLPRFVMDSYEECRGAPRLFLLDKFDVAGAGACLKRYTDPSVFRVESTASERSTIEPQREKRNRKMKKKGPRWRNGGTPEIGPTSHAKLHQLFLKERVESCFSDPSRLVKLKKRQLNGRMDSKNGKSYMEKFLRTPSPEHKMVYEASVAVPTLHTMSDNTTELGLGILDITTVHPVSKSPGRVSTCSSCISQEEELKSPVNGGVTGEEILKMPESTADIQIETTPNLQMVVVENQLEYGHGKTGSSIDGYHSDEVISEVENYVDALATMESEIETDNEPRSKTVDIGKRISESEANDEHLETQAQLSDSQSFLNSSGSDDGNSSFKRERSSFSCSDTVSSLVDNIQYDSEGTAQALSSISKACTVDIEKMPRNQDYTSHSPESNAGELGMIDNTSIDEKNISKSEEVPDDSSLLDSIPPQSLLGSESCPSPSLLVEPTLLKKSSTNLVNFGSQISSAETDLGCHKDDDLDVPSEAVSGANYTSPSQDYHIRDSVDGTSENALHLSNVLIQAIEDKAIEKVEDTMLQDDRTIDKQALTEIESSPSSLFPSETSRISTIYSLDKYYAIVLKGDANIVTAEAKYEDLPLAVDLSQNQDLKDDNIVIAEEKRVDIPLAVVFSQTQNLKDQVETVADDVLQVEDGLTETGGTYSVTDASMEDITSVGNNGKVTTFTHADDTSNELQLYPNQTIHEMHLNSREHVTETVQPESLILPTTSLSSSDELASPGDLDHEDSIKYSNFATGNVQADEMVDSVNCNEIMTEKVLAGEVVDSVNCRAVVGAKVQADELVDAADCSDVATKTAIIIEAKTKKLNRFSDEENVSIDKPQTGTFETDGFAFDADPTSSNIVNGCVSTSFNGLLSTSENMKSDLLKNHPGFENPYANHNEFKEASEDSIGPLIGNEVNHLEVAPAPLDSKDKLISIYPDSGIIDDIDTLPVHTETQYSLVSDNLSSHLVNLKESIEFILPSETSSEPSPGLEAVLADGDVPNSSCVDQRPRGQLDEEKVKLVQSLDSVRQGQSFKCKATESTIQAGHSLSELSIQHPTGERDMTVRKTDILQPVIPSYILLPELPHANMNEMPPLPPLPPMQWRLGKIQQPFLAPPRSEDPLQPILLSKAEEKSICLESSNAGTLCTENPYHFIQDNKVTHLSGHLVHNTVQPPTFSLHTIRNENFEYNSATMEKQYNNPFLELPPMPKKIPEHGSLKPDGDKVQSDSEQPSLRPTNNDVNCKSDSGSWYGLSLQSFSNSASETGLTPDISQHEPQDFEGEQRNSYYMMEPSSFVKNKQSQDDLATSGEEVASSSNSYLMPSTSEVGMPNGNPPTRGKLLRPRSPLIDAVAAHDKSKLRKVSDRIVPEIGPNVDERDSLLAQIRTKSFSLKPALVTRPSIQGPKTNLRVAAILEKANAIRQAFTGSDEDYDTDSWSDSE